MRGSLGRGSLYSYPMDYFFCLSPLVFYCKEEKTCFLSSSRLKKPIEPSELLEIVELELTFSFPSTISPTSPPSRSKADYPPASSQVLVKSSSQAKATNEPIPPTIDLLPSPQPSSFSLSLTSHLPPSPMSSIQTASASTPPSSNVRLVGFAAGVCSGSFFLPSSC